MRRLIKDSQWRLHRCPLTDWHFVLIRDQIIREQLFIVDNTALLC
jgi:hypothetical protein